MGKNVLVTGGAGFIGSHLVNLLTKKGYCVSVFDSLVSGDSTKVPDEVELLVGDIRDAAEVRRAVTGIETIFHLAAFTSVAGSIEQPELCFDVNVNGTRNILEQSMREGVGKIVFSSTSAVYVEYPDIPRTEFSPTSPISPYAESKLLAEDLVQNAKDEYRIDGSVLRYFNVYGHGQDPNSDYAAVIPAFLSRIRNDMPLTIYGDGLQTRDFVYVHDVANANLKAMANSRCGTFNVGTSSPVTIRRLAEHMAQIAGIKLSLTFEDARPGDVFSSTADISLIGQELGWAPEWDLGAGLRDIMRKEGIIKGYP